MLPWNQQLVGRHKRWALRDAIEPESSYLITPAGPGWQVVIRRYGSVTDPPIVVSTRAEACRFARGLSDSGLLGFIREFPT